VQSTGAQVALGRAATALDRAEPWPTAAERAGTWSDPEWERTRTKARKEARTVAALAAALCSRHMAPEDRCLTERTIASAVQQLIDELARVRGLLYGCGRPHPHPPAGE
jgi:hypothetical protein